MVAQQISNALCGHLFLANQEIQVALNALYAASKELVLDVDHSYFVIMGQENFCDARTHIAGAEYTNFHVTLSPLTIDAKCASNSRRSGSGTLTYS